MSSFRLGASGYTVFKRPLRFVNRQSARPVSFVGLQLTHTSAESVQPSLRLEDDTQVSSSQPVGHEPPHRSTQVLVGPVSGLKADTLVCQVQSSSRLGSRLTHTSAESLPVQSSRPSVLALHTSTTSGNFQSENSRVLAARVVILSIDPSATPRVRFYSAAAAISRCVRPVLSFSLLNGSDDREQSLSPPTSFFAGCCLPRVRSYTHACCRCCP
ncbi:hypothetical protein F442_03888 [Phytophthora nicotianae P10297]|uniref:Uncharacterized protein n=1 Tax=Phytophthora nicotianae P10297 TaxID=1317064 RepID=W2ZV40_PHYNI|nr:hypothetical protein F442_03888 [Phytophthora nicotianae P10297]